MSEQFENWCIIELFGHSQIAGYVTEQSISGASFVRVDVPATNGRDGFTKLYGPSAIYAITPTTEEIACIAANGLEVQPVKPWIIEHAKKQLPSPIIDPEPDGDYDDEDDYDDYGYDLDDDYPYDSQFTQDKQSAIIWAQDALDHHKNIFLILDTETTGLGDDAEVCQIAIIDMEGNKMFDRIIRPTVPIEPGAAAVHGITDENAASCPTLADVADELRDILSNRVVITYNADFDLRILRQSCHANGIDEVDMAYTLPWHCAMQWYAQYVGDWNEYHGNYKWQKLPGGDHSALGDCLATLEVIKTMAGEHDEEIPF